MPRRRRGCAQPARSGPPKPHATPTAERSRLRAPAGVVRIGHLAIRRLRSSLAGGCRGSPNGAPRWDGTVRRPMTGSRPGKARIFPRDHHRPGRDRMYCSLRLYRADPAKVDEITHLVDTDFADMLSEEPGFIDYQAVACDDGRIFSLTMWQD